MANLLKRLESEYADIREEIGLQSTKPQNLSFDEIVELIEKRLERHKQNNWIDLYPVAFARDIEQIREFAVYDSFDPLACIPCEPYELELFNACVQLDTKFNEDSLLACCNTSIYAYNSLVYSASLSIRHGEPLSEGLRMFAAKHLVKPTAPIVRKNRGAPRNLYGDDDAKISAIKLAIQYGLNATRNDVTELQHSACDAVSTAADLLSCRSENTIFSKGFSYETLKKLWANYRRNNHLPEEPTPGDIFASVRFRIQLIKRVQEVLKEVLVKNVNSMENNRGL